MEQLSKQKCVPCEGNEAPMTKAEVEKYLGIVAGWKDENNLKISQDFHFKDFNEAIDFINEIAKIAQSEGHHPDLKLYDYKNVAVTLWTHAIGGLSLNDFIMASKIDELHGA